MSLSRARRSPPISRSVSPESINNNQSQAPIGDQSYQQARPQSQSGDSYSFESPSHQRSSSNAHRPTPETAHQATNAPVVGNQDASESDISKEHASSPAIKGQSAWSGVRRPRHSIGRLWIWEIAAILFSLICMAAVIGVLVYEDGKPIDQWGWQITPNTVISFIATLAKSSFLLAVAETLGQLKWLHFHTKSRRLIDVKLFDEASRGPLGSIKLLSNAFRAKGSLIAPIAAFVVILALFVDPFIQLLLVFPSQRSLAPAVMEASFQTTTMHDPALHRWYANRNDGNEVASAIDVKMRSAIVGAFFAGDQKPTLTCRTGNCTFGPLTTLGVCAPCNDITKDVKYERHPVDPDLPSLTSHYVDYTLQSNARLMATYNHDVRSSVGTVDYSTRWNSTARTYEDLGDIQPNGDMTLIQLQAIRTKLDDTRNITLEKATRCAFSLCVKTFPHVVVTNGTTDMGLPDIDQLVLDPDTNPSNETRIPELSSKYGIRIGYPRYVNMLRLSSLKGGGDKTQYRINVVDQLNIANFLSGMFNAGYYDNGKTTKSIKFGTSDSDGVPDIGRDMANSPNIEKTMADIADSMTEAMRTNGNSTKHAGQAYTERVVVKVRWGYMAYPLVLLLLAMALLVSVIVQTKTMGAVAWKGSSLALLFHDVQGFGRVEGAESQIELDDEAKKMMARLGRDGDGLAFVKAD